MKLANLLAATSAAMALLAATPAHAVDNVTVAWLPIMQTTAFYVAMENGLFKKAGIEIHAVRFENPNQIVDALVSGQADVGAPGTAGGITALAESHFPGTFKVFGLEGGSIKAGRINDGLIVANQSSIHSFADLKGKSLGHLPGIQWRTIARYMVRKAGLDPDHDVRLQDIATGLQVPSVASGSVDATLSLEPVGSIAVASGEAKRAVVNPAEVMIAEPFYSGVSVLTTRFIRAHPDTARKIVDVLDEATRMTNASFDTYRPLIARYAAIEPGQARIVAQPYLRAWNDIDTTDIASYQALVDVFQKEGVLKQHVDVSSLILKPKDFNQ
ncbi:ABC transporter substrate-binding protein [Paraburkholderia silvatlantica]|uniref:ABC transporter substrate-binding protein n=1 Tax=Paraburkholderia silvatlantica TaxID=321895 RepID=UPI00105E3252|nr:ABC transporter substrate-binding protein [Paraburkholderia silvatlantica]TDQ89395.1 NitT/TauT family transport system substrate-binding protein [Paraburkholderia silvatlantica]